MTSKFLFFIMYCLRWLNKEFGFRPSRLNAKKKHEMNMIFWEVLDGNPVCRS
jgi:hypothetical protein